MFNKRYSLGRSPASLQTLGTHLPGWAQLGFLCSGGEAGLVPKWSSTLWASRPKPRTLAAGVPLITLGTSRTFYQRSSGPHSCPATILETQGGVGPCLPGLGHHLPRSSPPGGAAPTKQGGRQQWRDQRAEEGARCRSPPGPGPGQEAPPRPPRPEAISWLSPRLPGELCRARKVKYSLSVPADRLPASGPRVPPGGPLPPPRWNEGISGEGRYQDGRLREPRVDRGRGCELPPRRWPRLPLVKPPRHRGGSPGKPRKALKSGLGLHPRLQGGHSPCQPGCKTLPA